MIRPNYRSHVEKGLDAAYGKAEEVEFDPGSARMIIFSDLHKGSRDPADDFRRCERAYNAALGYYLEQGHTLFALGDVEELWECSPAEVIEAYPESLALEAEFHHKDHEPRHGRYQRFWGNHDDVWDKSGEVAKHLGSIFTPDLQVREALKLRAREGEHPGTLFLVHGHQGTAFSDRHRTIGRFFVHNFWRPIQRVTKWSLNTPATDTGLRHKHDTAMYEWALGHPERPVMIAGHTHHPVFWDDRENRQKMERQSLHELREETPPPTQEIAEGRARYELRDASWRWPGPPPRVFESPCYFNTGCCAFSDGDVTGIEIVDGEIRLVRWLDDDELPKPQILAQAELANVFEKVSAAPAPPVSAPA